MHTGKNAKYVMDYPKPNAKYPAYHVQNDPKVVKPIVQVDKDTVHGARFYAEAKWIVPGGGKDITLAEAHTHEFNEVVSFFGFNYDNIQDLGAEIEFTIDGEKNIVDRSFSACVPAGVAHGPLIIRNIQRPIMFIATNKTGDYK
jgi:hypothetical protein